MINYTFMFCTVAEIWKPEEWEKQHHFSLEFGCYLGLNQGFFWDFLILLSKCYHFTQNWVLFGLIHLKIKLIYNQFSPHLNSDLQVFLQGSNRIREIMCCSSCSLKQNPSQACAYGAGRFRDQINTFTLLYIFLLILNLYVFLIRNLKNPSKLLLIWWLQE